MMESFYGNKRLSKGIKGDLKRDDNTIKIAIEFCHEINSFEFLFEWIFKEFQKEGYEDKFVENLEPFILSGYFKDELLPNEVLKKICDYYFEHRKYLVLEKIVSCLNFSQYDLLDELTMVCSLKKLTTTLIHLTITSNQSEEDSCQKILWNVFDCFKSITNHVKLEDIKEFYKKTKDEKYIITSSYQYIGLKLMHIIKLFLKGERFPEGRFPKEKHRAYLQQTLEFITDNEKAFELVQLNARAFFTVASELFLNNQVVGILDELNKVWEAEGNLISTHEAIIDKFEDIVEALPGVNHLKFEYCYWIIKIWGSEVFR